MEFDADLKLTGIYAGDWFRTAGSRQLVPLTATVGDRTVELSDWLDTGSAPPGNTVSYAGVYKTVRAKQAPNLPAGSFSGYPYV